MRRTKVILIVAAIFAGLCLIGASSQTRSPTTQTPQRTATVQEQQLVLEKSAASQKRLNHYFHSDVIPKLKDCWSRIKGQGTVEIQHTYRRDATGKWVSDRLAVISSTLPAGQDAVALQCMQAAARGTTFPAQSNDSSEGRYVLYWSWPVPFPRDFPEPTGDLIRLASNGGRGGCDGKGAPAQCWQCGPRGWKKSCTGGVSCDMSTTFSNYYCHVGGNCDSGGPSFSGGGTVIE